VLDGENGESTAKYDLTYARRAESEIRKTGIMQDDGMNPGVDCRGRCLSKGAIRDLNEDNVGDQSLIGTSPPFLGFSYGVGNRLILRSDRVMFYHSYQNIVLFYRRTMRPVVRDGVVWSVCLWRS